MKLLVDTDLGTDGDDAIGLAYWLRQSRAEVTGATTFTPDPAGPHALAHLLAVLG